MASRKSVVFTKCSFSFTLRGTERGWRVLRTGTVWGQRRSPERGTGRGLCPARMQTDTPRPRGPCGGQWPPHAASLPSWQAAAPRREPHVLGEAMDAAGEVLRHRPALHGLDADLLQRLSEPGDGDSGVTRGASDTPRPATPPTWGAPSPPRSLDEVGVTVQLAPVLQATCPGEDAGDGVCAGGSSLCGKRAQLPGAGTTRRRRAAGRAHPPSGAPGSGG